ncbi:hypothetical protein AB9K26_02945 [Psychroserpens sp. XS_ASV72]|uniref:hypothetical protein n=1 Tax=Psychroserpens sp. XS_ASV72 TaxID=3241293 RepID=UPI00351642C8
MSKKINYLLILIGAIVAIYAQAGEDQNQIILIAGIVVLMMGIYRISKNIPSKHNQEDDHDNLPDS